MRTRHMQSPSEYVAGISAAFVQVDKDLSQTLISRVENVVLSGYK